MTQATPTLYRARLAAGPGDLAAAQALRRAAFRGPDGVEDADAFDAQATHVLIEEVPGGRLVCCFRLLAFADGSQISGSYAAQFYGLGRLAAYPGPMLELGRFCIVSDAKDPAVLRTAWAELARLALEHRTELIFGCSSFRGIEVARYADAFALLGARHIGPRRWLPRVKAPRVFRFARRLRLRPPDLAAAMRTMPPLLRSYLAMGGWVSDHAVVDADLETLHVFTGLELRALSPARRRFLSAAPS